MIDVFRPWWKLPRTTWVPLALVVALVGLAGSRAASLRRVNRRLERQVAERTAELEIAAGKLERLAWFDALTELAVPVRVDATVYPELRPLYRIATGLLPSFHFLGC